VLNIKDQLIATILKDLARSNIVRGKKEVVGISQNNFTYQNI